MNAVFKDFTFPKFTNIPHLSGNARQGVTKVSFTQHSVSLTGQPGI